MTNSHSFDEIPVRIAKMISRSGLCSRREAERWITAGRVSVNGKRLTSPALNVTPEDHIRVDGKALPAGAAVALWRFHKPKGYMTTDHDPQGRPTIFDALPPDMPRLVTVGRLDFNTEGLLLLTTDGRLSRHLELPSTGWVRRYRVRAHGELRQKNIDQLKQGIQIEGIRYGPIEVELDRTPGANSWMTLSLREGKNREIRHLLSHFGLQVNRLIRLSYGPFMLGQLKAKEIDQIKRKVLIDQLGVMLAHQFGLISRKKYEKSKAPTKPGNNKAKG